MVMVYNINYSKIIQPIIGVKMVEMNPKHVALVEAYLQEQGRRGYELSQGNECIVVSGHYSTMYFICTDEKIIDIQVD